MIYMSSVSSSLLLYFSVQKRHDKNCASHTLNGDFFIYYKNRCDLKYKKLYLTENSQFIILFFSLFRAELLSENCQACIYFFVMFSFKKSKSQREQKRERDKNQRAWQITSMSKPCSKMT